MITFHTIRFRNFLATGNSFQEITLDSHSKSLIFGRNGAGKSSMICALCFALYNKAYRNITKNQMINSINNGKTLVEVEFSTNGKRYLVRRGIKPNKFEIEIDGETLPSKGAKEDQDFLEQEILRINYKAFTQIVIVGSTSYKAFMHLPPADRRIVLENLLDLRVFEQMNDYVKKQLKDEKALLSSATNDRDMAEKDWKHLEQLKATQDQFLQQNLESIENKIAEESKEYQNVKNNFDQLEQKIQKIDIDKLNDAKKKFDDRFRKIIEYRSEYKTIKNNASKVVSFYDKNDLCPTCKQPLDQHDKTTQLNENHSLISDAEEKLQKIDASEAKYKEQYKLLEQKLSEYQKLENDLSNTQRDLSRLERSIQSYQKQLEEEKNNTLDDESLVSDDDIKEKKSQYDVLVNSVNEKSQYIKNLNTAQKMLKDDGIKQKMIDEYIPIINEKVNDYLEYMNFFCNFTLDNQFNETILSRYRDAFTYDSFSEGQKFRIDLSLLFTWRDIANMRNAVDTNLLIMDEVFNGPFDEEGMELFIQLLTAVSENCNIIIITPRTDLVQIDSFDRRLEVVMEDSFSLIEER